MTTEIITPEVIEEIPLEKVIDNTLVKHNVTDAVINSLKEKYGNLRLNNIDDKEQYLIIKEAKKDVRKWGILTEKLCKAGREEAVKTQKLWLSKEKEILGKIAEVENPLQSEIDRFDAEVERKANLEKERKETAYINRQALLTKMGATYDNGSFIINHVSFEANQIKEADEDIWNDVMLPKYQVQFEKNEAVRIEQERARQAEYDRLQKEREDLERQQIELREAQAELQRQKDEATRQQRLEQERIEEENRKRDRERIDRRVNQLRSLGMTFNFQYDAYVFQDVNVDNKTEISLLDDTNWDALILKITPVIADRKAEAERIAEEKRLAEIEEARKSAVENERLRIEEENRVAELKKQQEEAQRQEALAKASDKERWQHFLGELNSIQLPEFKSKAYKERLAVAKEKISELNEL